MVKLGTYSGDKLGIFLVVAWNFEGGSSGPRLKFTRYFRVFTLPKAAMCMMPVTAHSQRLFGTNQSFPIFTTILTLLPLHAPHAFNNKLFGMRTTARILRNIQWHHSPLYQRKALISFFERPSARFTPLRFPAASLRRSRPLEETPPGLTHPQKPSLYRAFRPR